MSHNDSYIVANDRLGKINLPMELVALLIMYFKFYPSLIYYLKYDFLLIVLIF